MSTTAEKLTYLNNTKVLIKDNINLTGAGLTNQTPFRQYATDLKTALLNILNNGIDTLYNNFPKTTGTGTNISLNNTLQAPMRSVINGDTEQDGEPTPDNPQEIKSVTGLQKVSVKGKNLFDNVKPNIYFTSNKTFANAQGASTTDYIPAKQGDIFTISALNHSNGIVIASFDENYNCLERSAISTISSIRPLTHTCPENTAYIIGSNYNYTDNPTQLEYGFATDYEPYQSQEYEINLGKNLLPYDLAKLKSINNGGTWEGDVYTLFGVTYTYNEDGSLTLGGNATGLSYINLYSSNTKSLIDENTTYTYSKGITNINIPIAIYEYINNSWVSKKYVTTPSTTYIPSGEQTGQIIRLLVNNGTDLSTPITVFPMIEKGTEATPYSPYFTPIHLYENDQIIGTPYNWSIKHVMGEVVLDGTETWNYQYTNGWNCDIPNLKQTTTNSEQPYCISNYYTKNSANSVYSSMSYGITQRPNYSAIIIKNVDIASSDALKTWLSTHNTKVVYELAEPTTEPITNTELIEDLNNFYNKAKSYNGQTNISVEGDLSMILDVSAIIGD